MERVLERMEVEDLTAFDIAKTFLNYEKMTPKKLQKLCYYAYAWYLTLYKKRLFNGRFQAWIHGPVLPELYQEYKSYGRKPIDKTEVPDSVRKKPDVLDIIELVYKSYGHLDGDELEYLTHLEEPWLAARKGYRPDEPCQNEIDDHIIYQYYSKVYEEGQND